MPGRDIGRAKWQRGEGTVLYSYHADVAYTDSTRFLSDQFIADILANPFYTHSPDFNDFAFEGDEDPVAVQAMRIAKAIFPPPAQQFGPTHTLPDSIEENIDRHTYQQSFEGTFDEANETMSSFPLSLALTLATVAEEQKVDGYALNNLHDYANMMRRGDFRSLVDVAAFTSNGYWGNYANSLEPDLRQHTGNDAIFYDHEMSQMRFSDDLIRQLHRRMARGNKKGQSDAPNIAIRPSSGCPARHLQPHFDKGEEAEISIGALAEHFGLSPSEILATRDQSAINVGLDFLADTFDRAASLQEHLAATGLIASV